MDFLKVEKILNYRFKDKSLLQNALTHKSFEEKQESYEKLEFLGDSLLQGIVTKYLYFNYTENEGVLSKYRAKIVSEQTLVLAVTELGLDKHIRVGKSIKKISNSIIADVYESVLASMYLDGGQEIIDEFVMNTLIKDKYNINNIIRAERDYKTELQEYLQALPNRPKFEYKTISEKDLDGNKKEFVVALYVDNKIVAKAVADSKKKCEIDCCKQYLSQMNK